MRKGILKTSSGITQQVFYIIMDYLKILAKNQNQRGRSVEKDNFNQNKKN